MVVVPRVPGVGVGVVMHMVLMLVGMLMAVVPQLGLGQQEEEHHADQQRHEQILGAGLAVEGFGQQVHEGRGQQGPGGQAEQALLRAAAGALAETGLQKKVSHPDAADAGSQGGHDDGDQCHNNCFLSGRWPELLRIFAKDAAACCAAAR